MTSSVTAPMPILTQLQAILERDAEADQVALVWPEPLEQSTITVNVQDKPVCLVYCQSELAMREALVNHVGPGRLVLLSKFDEVHLAKDVLARLWRNSPQRISPWKTLQQLIKVREIDPRITRQKGRWMAEALLGSFDRYHKKIMFGEVLDRENAWRALAVGYLGYGETSVDLPLLFDWSMNNDVADLVEKLPKDVKNNLGDWFEQSIPDMSNLINCLFKEGHANDLLAIGLACSVMFDKQLILTQLIDDQDLYLGQGRFKERFIGETTIKPKLFGVFGTEAVKAAMNMLRENGDKQLNGALNKAEQLLASLNFMPAIEISDILPASFNQRLSIFALQLEEVLKTKELGQIVDSFTLLQQHALADSPSRKEQIERAKMALRLVTWLSLENDEPTSLNEIISDYIHNGSFIDWARYQIWSGDIHEPLSKVYQKLSEQITIKQEQQNKHFSTYLNKIARNDKLASGFVPVEQAIEQVLVPIAKHSPVLLLVLDGMSQAVYRELNKDLVKHNWVEIHDSQSKNDKCLVSALPSITQVSRCSLLSGKLCEGSSNDEKKLFANNSILKKLSSTKFPPILYHKQELQQSGSGALSSEVRANIASTEHRVLATVINAIDDQLSSSSQVSLDWTLESVTLLRQVLEAARESGRVVVMTSDHGHVLDHNSFYANSDNENGERYQLGSQTDSEHEVQLSGDRVVTPHNTVVLPWTERLRYTKSKNMGYHGGGSLQEMIIPLGIFVNANNMNPIEEWHEIPRYIPDWWSFGSNYQEEEHKVEATFVKKKISKPVKVKITKGTELIGDLFDTGYDESEATKSESHSEGDWIVSLFNSDVFVQMKIRAGRSAINDEKLKPLLELLEQNNGQVMEAVMLRHLSIPKIRLRGFLSGVQKLLNVDGYPILSVDRESETVKLNINDLKKQFEL